MNYKGTLIAVKDIEKAKQFYQSVFGLDIVMDAGANVQLTGGLFLQTLDTWSNFIHKAEKEIIFANNAVEIYFETDDINAFTDKLKSVPEIVYIHPLTEHSWGQSAIRFYDLDDHIVEVAENLDIVVKRFIDSGLTVEQTAERMDVDVQYIKSILDN